jgi:dTDP-6-deoxy-L-talose 4-dehydrogenase (NAD+)
MKILVTGATGFIGNYVVNELLRHNCDVIATSIDSAEAKPCSWLSKVTYIPCDLNLEKNNYFTFFNEPDLLIHLAWEGLPNYKELFHIEKNLFFNYRFLKNIIENGLKDLTSVGTCLEYGMQTGALSENTPANPTTAYGLAKDTLRKFLEQLQKKTEFKFKWIRLFYTYGKGQSHNSLLIQLEQAIATGQSSFNMSKGQQIRDYLPVEKLAEYIVNISLQNKVTGIINCCSGKPITVEQFVRNYLKKIEKNIKLNLGYYPYPDYEPMEFWGDTAKLNPILKVYK